MKIPWKPWKLTRNHLKPKKCLGKPANNREKPKHWPSFQSLIMKILKQCLTIVGEAVLQRVKTPLAHLKYDFVPSQSPWTKGIVFWEISFVQKWWIKQSYNGQKLHTQNRIKLPPVKSLGPPPPWSKSLQNENVIYVFVYENQKVDPKFGDFLSVIWCILDSKTNGNEIDTNKNLSNLANLLDLGSHWLYTRDWRLPRS